MAPSIMRRDQFYFTEKNIDFSARGYYKENPVYNSFSFRVKLKLNMWKTGLQGSYWDIIKRKCLK